jgi:hypothetical protein
MIGAKRSVMQATERLIASQDSATESITATIKLWTEALPGLPPPVLEIARRALPALRRHRDALDRMIAVLEGAEQGKAVLQ